MLDHTLAALVEVARGATDARGYFPAMYARVTRTVLDDIAADRFTDPDRMDRFVSTFAARYLRAAADSPRAARSWRAAFDVAGDGHLVVVQHLLLGINAHVNLDLAPTVAELVDAGATLESLRPDFDAVNDVLAAVYRDLATDLGRVTRWTAWADAWGGGRLFRFSLRQARQQAWQSALRLVPLDGPARRHQLEELDDAVAVLAYLVTRPVAPVRWATTVLRRLETSDPAVVTRAILGPLAGST